MLIIKRGTAARLGLRPPQRNERTPGWATMREMRADGANLAPWVHGNRAWCGRQLPRGWWTGNHSDIPTYCARPTGHDPVPWCPGNLVDPAFDWPVSRARQNGKNTELARHARVRRDEVDGR